MKQKVNIFWFRRDIRLHDNHGLFKALQSEIPVQPIFIFDKNILDRLPSKADRRVEFIHQEIEKLNNELIENGATIDVRYGQPVEIWKQLINEYEIGEVFTNHDYEKYGIERDQEIKTLLGEKDISFSTFKDQVIFEKEEVLSNEGNPYSVFTPYSRKWKAKLEEEGLIHFKSEDFKSNYFKSEAKKVISLKEMGFEAVNDQFPDKAIDKEKVKVYDKERDFPAKNGTTHLSVHLRFGTVSIRNLVEKALKLNGTWLNELIWRDFYMAILANFPHINDNKAFRSAYDNIQWRNNEAEFEKWKNGQTGFPIVDAGMRELNKTGFMHNRVRMITASFLIKDLLVDWRWGEAYFAEKLLDFDFAANNGGWQWAAGSGCDAAPYFRVFNPDSQAKKFDPDLKYIKKWIPELNEFSYPKPMVDHKMARERALKTYKEALA